MNPADRRHARLDRIVDRGLKRDGRRFGHAVADRDLRNVHPVQHLFHHSDRTWRAGHDPGAQRVQAIVSEGRVLELCDEHRRHAVDRRAAMSVDRAERRLRIERLGGQDDRGAVGDGREVGHHAAETVIEGHRHANPVRLGVSQHFSDEEAVVEDVVVRQRCALRRPGRARGVLNVDGVVELQGLFAGAKRGGIDPVALFHEVGPGDSPRCRFCSEVDHVAKGGNPVRQDRGQARRFQLRHERRQHLDVVDLPKSSRSDENLDA